MTRDWHTADFPELRDGPPWVMEEMIHAQASLPDDIAANASVAAVRDLVRRARASGQEVVVTGCGTSEHAAMAIAALLDDASGGSARCQVRQALDAALDPPGRGVVIGVSHDGGTRATLLALQQARAAGAVTAVITARGDSAVADAADVTVVTPMLDRSWCHTVAFSSAILAGAAIAYGEGGTGWATGAAETIGAVLASGTSREAGRRLHPTGRVVTAGMGVDLIAARELALKIEEGARIPATAHHLETLLHGHLAACQPTDTHLVLLAGDRSLGERHRRRLQLAARTVTAIGTPTTAVAAEEIAAELPDGVDIVPLPRASGAVPGRLHDLLALALGVQLLTLGLVDAAGTNPDLIRREQAPYRAAAAVGDETADW